jgi:HSP20 family protein
MDDMLRRYAGSAPRLLRTEDTQWTPTANISETEKEYIIRAELPEVKKEDIKVQLANGVITLSGERKREKEHSGENEIRIESFYGTFSRSFALPENIETNGIRAESRDGVLHIHIPKTVASKPKQVNVEVR